MYIEGIILAAGLSSRFPEYKMQMKIGEITVLERAILSMSMYVNKIYVVTGYNREIIEKICSNYSFVETIYNENYSDGMFSSIKKAVSKITGSRFFLMPGDYTMVKMDTFKYLLDQKGDVVIPSYDFKAGHPILLSSELAKEIMNSKATHLRAFLRDYDKVYIPVSDEGVLLDIDTYEDYEDIKRRFEDEDN